MTPLPVTANKAYLCFDSPMKTEIRISWAQLMIDTVRFLYNTVLRVSHAMYYIFYGNFIDFVNWYALYRIFMFVMWVTLGYTI